MSKVDELHLLSDEPCGFYNREDVPAVPFDEAAAIIRQLEEALAAEHEAGSVFESETFRIAGIAEENFNAELAAARAEVPECYAEVIRALHAYCRGDDNDGDPLDHAITLVDGFSEEQLRACGIDNEPRTGGT